MSASRACRGITAFLALVVAAAGCDGGAAKSPEGAGVSAEAKADIARMIKRFADPDLFDAAFVWMVQKGGKDAAPQLIDALGADDAGVRTGSKCALEQITGHRAAGLASDAELEGHWGKWWAENKDRPLPVVEGDAAAPPPAAAQPTRAVPGVQGPATGSAAKPPPGKIHYLHYPVAPKEATDDQKKLAQERLKELARQGGSGGAAPAPAPEQKTPEPKAPEAPAPDSGGEKKAGGNTPADAPGP